MSFVVSHLIAGSLGWVGLGLASRVDLVPFARKSRQFHLPVFPSPILGPSLNVEAPCLRHYGFFLLITGPELRAMRMRIAPSMDFFHDFFSLFCQFPRRPPIQSECIFSKECGCRLDCFSVADSFFLLHVVAAFDVLVPSFKFAFSHIVSR